MLCVKEGVIVLSKTSHFHSHCNISVKVNALLFCCKGCCCWKDSNSACCTRGAHTTTFLLKVSLIIAFHERINLVLVPGHWEKSFLRDLGPIFGIVLAF